MITATVTSVVVSRTTGMQGNSHEQSSESIEWIALGFHCSLRAHGCLPAAAQRPSPTPHAVHFGGHTHGLCHRAWDPSIRVETLCRLFYRRLRHQLELRDLEHPDRIPIRSLRLHRQPWSKALAGAAVDHACVFLDGLYRVDAGTCSSGPV